MSKGSKERANESGEKYLRGRASGVEGTFGKGRTGVVEKTVIGHGDQRDSGSLDPELGSAASSLYSRAVGPGEDPSRKGDQALRDR